MEVVPFVRLLPTCMEKVSKLLGTQGLLKIRTEAAEFTVT